MNIAIGILTTVEVIVALLLVGIILLQPSKAGGGLGGMGGGVTEQVFGATAGNVLTKVTVWLASIFMGITLSLVVLGAHRQGTASKSIVETGNGKPAATAPAKAPATAPAAPKAPAVPAAPAVPETPKAPLPAPAAP